MSSDLPGNRRPRRHQGNANFSCGLFNFAGLEDECRGSGCFCEYEDLFRVVVWNFALSHEFYF